jgi:hypothetical protein
MFFLWTVLGIAALVTEHAFQWWYTAILIFTLALDNLTQAVLKVFRIDV